MTERTITISGKEVKFRQSAAIPRIYRMRFGRDIFTDLSNLEKKVKTNKNQRGGSQLDVESLEVFENVAFIMARHADPEIPDNVDEWLEQFDIFSIYEVLPQILEMWNTNMKTDIQPKKKSRRRAVK